MRRGIIDWAISWLCWQTYERRRPLEAATFDEADEFRPSSCGASDVNFGIQSLGLEAWELASNFIKASGARRRTDDEDVGCGDGKEFVLGRSET